MASVNHIQARSAFRLAAVLCLFAGAGLVSAPASRAQQMDHSHHAVEGDVPVMPSAWMIVHMIRNPMLPGAKRLRPTSNLPRM